VGVHACVCCCGGWLATDAREEGTLVEERRRGEGKPTRALGGVQAVEEQGPVGDRGCAACAATRTHKSGSQLACSSPCPMQVFQSVGHPWLPLVAPLLQSVSGRVVW